MATTQGSRIVVGIDGSSTSLAAFGWAAQQAELTGAILEAVCTWEWPTSYGWALPLPQDFDPAADVRTMLNDAVRQVESEHPDVDIRSIVVEGHPAPVLLEASEGADLLVVGSRGHGEFAGMLLGSVSEHCVSNATCPVLVWREP